MASSPDALVTAAHHEAGHALVAYWNGVKHQSITVDQEGRGSFTCDRNSLTPEIDTMIAMAGTASAILCQNANSANLPSFDECITSDVHWSDTDRQDALRHTESLPAAEQRCVREHYWNRTLAVLRSRWPSVQAVASAVIENGTLTDRQIWDLLK